RRVLPALRSLAPVKVIAVASHTAQRTEIDPNVEFYGDYEAAINASGADVAYVSVANSDHKHWAERCLQTGMHVVVDKPACLTAADAHRLADLAAARHRCLAEATVFAFHPQIEALRHMFEDASVRP